MKYPLVAVVVCYAAGLLLAEFFQTPPAALLAVSFVLLALALVLEKLRLVLIWPLLVLVGWTNLAVHNAVISPNNLRALMGNEAALVTLRGTLVATPDLKIYQRDGDQTEHTLAQVRVSELRRGADWQPAIGMIMVTMPGKLASNYFAGQPVEISGTFSPPPQPVAEGLFDYRTYLAQQGIYFQLKTAAPDDWKLLSANPIPSLSDRFLRWSQKTLARGLPDEDEPLQLLWAINESTIGTMPARQSQTAKQSGCSYGFADLPLYASECFKCSLQLRAYFFASSGSWIISKFSAFSVSAPLVKLKLPVMTV